MSDDTRDLAQRIRDALRGVTKGGWLVRGDAIMSPRVLVAVANSEPTVGEWRNNAALIAAAPGLLRDALARIEADAATIAALEAEVARLSDKLRPSEVDPTVCDMCEGTGKVNRLNRDGSVEPVDCRACWGTGANRRAIGYDDE